MTSSVFSQIFQAIVEIPVTNDINMWAATKQFFDIIKQSSIKFFKSARMSVALKHWSEFNQ